MFEGRNRIVYSCTDWKGYCKPSSFVKERTWRMGQEEIRLDSYRLRKDWGCRCCSRCVDFFRGTYSCFLH
jgi:hypothetical protein